MDEKTNPESEHDPIEEGAETPAQAPQAEGDALQKELLYLRADFDNYKKRVLKDQEQAIRFANEKLIRDLVAAMDVLEMGLQHGRKLKETSGNNPDLVNFVNGMEMSARELVQLLGRFGVEFIGKAGDKFDPLHHEAVSQVPVSEDKVDTLIDVFQRGSLLHGRLLRPARVSVGVQEASS